MASQYGSYSREVPSRLPPRPRGSGGNQPAMMSHDSEKDKWWNEFLAYRQQQESARDGKSAAPAIAPSPAPINNPQLVRCTSCQGWHPGGADRCWLNPNSPQNRLGDAAYRCYAAQITPHIPINPARSGYQHLNPTIHKGDSLLFAILTADGKKELSSNGGETSMEVTWSQDNLLICRDGPPKEGTKAIQQGQAIVGGKRRIGSQAKEEANDEDRDTLEKLDKQIQEHKRALQLQARQKELDELKMQLDKGKPNEQTPQAKGKSNTSASASTAGQVKGNAGLTMLMGAADEVLDAVHIDNGKHLQQNVGQWTRTKRSSQWNAQQVERHIGTLKLARLGMWHNFTVFYAQEEITTSLKKAFLMDEATQVAKALRDAKLAIKDVSEMGDCALTGDLNQCSE